jgi:fused signal recognition particle receptor
MFDFFRKKKPQESDEQPSDRQDQSRVEAEKEEAPPTRQSLLQKLAAGLNRTREKVQERVQTIAAARRGITDDFYDDIIEVLVETDMGMEAAEELIRLLKREVGARGAKDTAEACDLLIEVMARKLASDIKTLTPEILSSRDISGAVVLLLTGVNGSGKTTVCGKLARRFTFEGKKVLVVASDTFRAAAIDQLKVWADRAGADFQGAPEGRDPSSVVYDGLARAKSEGHHVVIVDTAGRLQNKVNLMNELGKIRRTVDKQAAKNAIQSLLVVDSTTGQNAITQAEVFGEVAKIDGIILTKLDGTARGGIVLAINELMKLPVVEVGVGEGINDLVPFDAAVYARSLLGDISGDEIDWRSRAGYSD